MTAPMLTPDELAAIAASVDPICTMCHGPLVRSGRIGGLTKCASCGCACPDEPAESIPRLLAHIAAQAEEIAQLREVKDLAEKYFAAKFNPAAETNTKRRALLDRLDARKILERP